MQPQAQGETASSEMEETRVCQTEAKIRW